MLSLTKFTPDVEVNSYSIIHSSDLCYVFIFIHSAGLWILLPIGVPSSTRRMTAPTGWVSWITSTSSTAPQMPTSPSSGLSSLASGCSSSSSVWQRQPTVCNITSFSNLNSINLILIFVILASARPFRWWRRRWKCPTMLPEWHS